MTTAADHTVPDEQQPSAPDETGPGDYALPGTPGKPLRKAVAKKAPARQVRPKADPNRKTAKQVRDERVATEQAEKATEEMEETSDEETPEEREQWFQSPSFQRMKTAWGGDDAIQMQRIQGLVDRQVFDAFPEAYAVMYDLWDIVRDYEVNEVTQEVQTDAAGLPVWKKDPRTGAYIEDWNRLTTRHKEDFLYRITTGIFEWELRAETKRTEALYAKAIFTEKYSIEFDAPLSGTIEDRNARGTVESAEERYFALMLTSVSRKADSIVRTMNALALRLRDTLS